MGLVLPAERYTSQNPVLVSSRNDMRSATGGNAQRIARKGSHYRVEFTAEPMPLDEARAWSDLKTEADTVIAQLLQPGADVGNPGVGVAVNGGPFIGTMLPVKGLTPGYVIAKDQPLTHRSAAGVHRLYEAAASVTANGSGQATIPLRTMMTAPAQNNDQVLIAAPVIEGFPTLDPSSWLQDGDGHVRLKFSIEEPG